MKSLISFILFSSFLFACVPSQPSTISSTPSLTPISTSADVPTPIPPTSTPTATSTNIPTQIVFVTLDQCDNRDHYPALSQPYLWTDNASRFVRSTYNWNGQDRYYLGWIPGNKALIIFAYKKDLKSPVVALPPEFWAGQIPSNRFCLIGGKWYPLPPIEGELQLK